MNRCSREVSIVNELGLHARAAAKVAEIAGGAKSSVWILKNDQKVDAKSVIDILTLGCGKEAMITIQIERESDENILDDIVRLVESGFGE
ncbi:HPr family phosphocarrier protein [Desulfobacterales bacterium HSG16]|nr:HPr family phosphocarrier protein [Desulfobacterales bacterium HSG16]